MWIKKYSPNEEIIKTISNGGAINYDNSSIAVTATRWVVYDEDELKDSGQLKGTTFEKFKSAHSDPVQVDATQDEIDLIAKATGIQSSAIKLVCYERPQLWNPRRRDSTHRTLQILLADADFSLLGYVYSAVPENRKWKSRSRNCLSMPCWRLLQITTMKIWKISGIRKNQKPGNLLKNLWMKIRMRQHFCFATG